MRIVTFAPMYNTGTKKDATGAFQPEMMEFCALFDPSAPPHLVDNHGTKSAMRARILGHIQYASPTICAFFGHGWRTGIQFGFGIANVKELAKALAYGCTSVRVVLYACSTGDGAGPGGDGGFADALRDALCVAGAPFCQVDAHDRPGHATRNPYVRRFMGQGSNVGGTGGQWIVAPGSALWGRWKAALAGDLRLRFPMMDVGEIHAELAR